MSEITYIGAPNGPYKVGEYEGRDIFCFGVYRVDLGDWVYLSPHSGFRDEPLPLDDEDVRAMLIDAAERSRRTPPVPPEDE